MSASEREPLTVLLAADYRIRETFGGWVLEFQDPCMFEWHEVALRSTARACGLAYAAISEGLTVRYDG